MYICLNVILQGGVLTPETPPCVRLCRYTKAEVAKLSVSTQISLNLWKKKSARGNNQLAIERGEIMKMSAQSNNQLANKRLEIIK